MGNYDNYDIPPPFMTDPSVGLDLGAQNVINDSVNPTLSANFEANDYSKGMSYANPSKNYNSPSAEDIVKGDVAPKSKSPEDMALALMKGSPPPNKKLLDLSDVQDKTKSLNESVAASGAQVAAAQALLTDNMNKWSKSDNAARRSFDDAIANNATTKQSIKDYVAKNPILSEQDVVDKWSTSQRVMTGIANALGAFSSALTHGPNYAFEATQSLIKSEVQKSRDKFNMGLDALSREASLDLDGANLAKMKFEANNTMDQKIINGAQGLVNLASQLTNDKAKALDSSKYFLDLKSNNNITEFGNAQINRTFSEDQRNVANDAIQNPKYNAITVNQFGNKTITHFNDPANTQKSQQLAMQAGLKSQTLERAKKFFYDGRMGDAKNELQKYDESQPKDTSHLYDRWNQASGMGPEAFERFISNEKASAYADYNAFNDNYSDRSYNSKAFQKTRELLNGIESAR